MYFHTLAYKDKKLDKNLKVL